MKKGIILSTIVGAALLTAAPLSLQWSQKTGRYPLTVLMPELGAR